MWLKLHTRFAADDQALRTELEKLRERAGVPSEVSLLRTLDVALWMRHHGEHRTGTCSGFGALPLG